MPNSVDLFQKLSDRLRYIEFSLLYKGAITRADLMDKFEISEASATRAIKEYIELSDHKNAYFNSETKANEIGEDFTPLYHLSEEEALYWLQLENQPQLKAPLIYSFPRINLPDGDVLAPIIQGIIRGQCVEISYLSLKSSQEKKRVIIPHSLFNDGLRLYIRLFDRKYEKFLDLTPSRMTKATLLAEKPHAHEMLEQDDKWNDIVELSLVPHPNFSQDAANVIAYEYQMVRRKRKVAIRKATLNYFLKAWNVDCTENATLNEKEYHLWLENRNIVELELNAISVKG